LKRSLLVVMGLLVLAATAATAADPTVAGKAGQVAAAQAVIGADLVPPAPQNLFKLGGCVASIGCPDGGSVSCTGSTANACMKDTGGSPPWVACDGVIRYCP
jgi:hypothetical protein